MNKQKPIKELLQFAILNIDKSSGPTSFTISDFVREQLAEFGVKKTSHFGTLDPRVTGVLPIALGRACRLTGFFLGHDKTYVGVMHTREPISIKELQKVINEKFIGKILQLPPKKSRVKRAIREREIINFDILEASEDSKTFSFKTKVQGGTYIRKLIHDLGEDPRVKGAHMVELRRTNAGIFSENDKEFTNLYDFQKAVEEYKKGDELLLRKILVSGEDAIKQVMPIVQVHEKVMKKLLTGKPLFEDEIVGKTPEEDKFAVFCKDKFIEIAKKVKEGNLIARSEFVFN